VPFSSFSFCFSKKKLTRTSKLAPKEELIKTFQTPLGFH